MAVIRLAISLSEYKQGILIKPVLENMTLVKDCPTGSHMSYTEYDDYNVLTIKDVNNLNIDLSGFSSDILEIINCCNVIIRINHHCELIEMMQNKNCRYAFADRSYHPIFIEYK